MGGLLSQSGRPWVEVEVHRLKINLQELKGHGLEVLRPSIFVTQERPVFDFGPPSFKPNRQLSAVWTAQYKPF